MNAAILNGTEYNVRQKKITAGGMVSMSEREFARLSEYIYATCGIHITAAKKTMLEARLSKRLKELQLDSYTDYCAYLFSGDDPEEVISMIDIVTTNKTEFFREPAHFDYLSRHALPQLAAAHGAGVSRPFMIWSAGCSTGEEPYTMSIVLKEYAALQRSYSFMVLATDISTKVLQHAQKAIYEMVKVAPVPEALLRKYFTKGKGDYAGYVRVAEQVREHVRFRRLNFMESDFGMRELMDVIFCRNVIIYFDRATQEKLLRRFCEHLVPGGYIFMGHSETLHGMNLPLRNVAPTVYQKKEVASAK